MSVAYYRLRLAVAASLSLMVAACGSSPPPDRAAASGKQTAASSDLDAGGIDTEATIWTALGLAKKPSAARIGPQTGPLVNPVLWQASLDTLKFVPMRSSDPLTGAMATEWYSPRGKPDERFRVEVFVLSRALTSAALAVTVKRQVRSPGGGWVDSTVDREVVDQLDADILHRAQQLQRAWYPES